MDSIDIISKYFPNLLPLQLQQLQKFAQAIIEWNARINLISRKDIDNIFTHHILHSLTIAKYFEFAPHSRIIDIGTGGGFPGIPLAIYFPECSFTLVDSIAKKITVVKDVIDTLQLKNAIPLNTRAENIVSKYDIVVSRATAPINDLMRWCKPLIDVKSKMPYKGLVALKGGNVELEGEDYTNYMTIRDLNVDFTEPFFETKKVAFIHTP